MAKNNAEPQMNPNFTAYIAPARNEARWWKVLLTLVVWFGVYALLGNILAVGFVRVFQVKELTQGVRIIADFCRLDRCVLGGAVAVSPAWIRQCYWRPAIHSST